MKQADIRKKKEAGTVGSPDSLYSLNSAFRFGLYYYELYILMGVFLLPIGFPLGLVLGAVGIVMNICLIFRSREKVSSCLKNHPELKSKTVRITQDEYDRYKSNNRRYMIRDIVTGTCLVAVSLVVEAVFIGNSISHSELSGANAPIVISLFGTMAAAVAILIVGIICYKANQKDLKKSFDPSLPQRTVCGHCGAKMKKGSTFCNECGMDNSSGSMNH